MGLYLRPTDLAAALEALAGSGFTVLAGGTDFYPARVGRPLKDDILDISAVTALRGIVDAGIPAFGLGPEQQFGDFRERERSDFRYHRASSRSGAKASSLPM